MTYDRQVTQCSKSNYAKMVTISDVVPAQNSDNLDCIQFKEVGWQTIAKRGEFKPGAKVMFLPPESVLPKELIDELGVEGYLSKGKVKAIKLRGNRSEGLIVDHSIVKPYVDYILHWEEIVPIASEMKGQTQKKIETPGSFHIFYKIQNLLNEPDTFVTGEKIFHSEKVHGTNCRFGYLLNPRNKKYQLYVGSHNTVRREFPLDPPFVEKFIKAFRRLKKDKIFIIKRILMAAKRATVKVPKESGLYWRVVRNYAQDETTLPKDIVFYGEIYGAGVQDLTYALDNQKLIVFAASVNGEYLNANEVTALCAIHNLPCVKFYGTIYKDIEQIRSFAETKSEMPGFEKSFREGVVVVSDAKPIRMAKMISLEYLSRKKGSEKH